MFLPMRFMIRRPGRAALSCLLLAAAGPARAVTFDDMVSEGRELALTTGDALAAFAGRIMKGDMAAAQEAILAFSALVAVIGLWMLLRPRRAEAAAPGPDMGDRQRSPAQPVAAHSDQPPPPAPKRFQPGAARPLRLLEAVAAARTQFEIGLAERKGNGAPD